MYFWYHFWMKVKKNQEGVPESDPETGVKIFEEIAHRIAECLIFFENMIGI